MISTDPDIERLSVPRLSPGQFTKLAQEHVGHINKTKQALQHISLPFNSKGTILPIQCQKAISTLNELSDRVQKFCELLDETSHMPLVLTALRYELLYSLYAIKEHARKLEDLIESYCMICMSPSTSHAPRKQVYAAFQTLFQQISDASQQIKFQGEVARFQERRLISVFGEG